MIDLRLHERLSPLIGIGEGQMSQSELAKASCVPQPSISAWLSGRRSLPLERQIDLAEALGFDQIELRLERSKKPSKPAG